jgi:hypothetical protein
MTDTLMGSPLKTAHLTKAGYAVLRKVRFMAFPEVKV